MAKHQITLDGSKYTEPPTIPQGAHCFSCMEPIENFNDFTQFRVNTDFCHSSYWENTKPTARNPHPKIYGQLETDGKHGNLFLHRKCDASEDFGNPYGEGYMDCEECSCTFSDNDFSGSIYDKSGMVLCPQCAVSHVESNLEQFLNSGLPDFTKRLPSVNLSALEVDNNPKLRHAPEDMQGWCSSINPHGTHDIGHGTYEDAIKAIVARGNKWLIVTGGPNVTHNICAVAVDVYEYSENGFQETD